MQMHAKKIHIIKQIPYHNIKIQLQSTKGIMIDFMITGTWLKENLRNLEPFNMEPYV